MPLARPMPSRNPDGAKEVSTCAVRTMMATVRGGA